MTLVPVDYFEELDHRFTPRRRPQANNLSRTVTALAAVLVSIAALIFALVLGNSDLPEGSRVVMRLDPMPAAPTVATPENLDISAPVPAKKPEVLMAAEEAAAEEPAAQAQVALAPQKQAPTKPRPQARTPQDLSLAAAPIAKVSETGPHGPLPIPASDGTNPLKAYARPFDAADTRPRIYLVIGGLGFFPEATEEAIQKLPDAVTLGFAPYGDNLQNAINNARADGHEVLLEVPMEPFAMGTSEPGPHTLQVHQSTDQTLDNLHWLMSRASGYVGIVNYLGARFMSQPENLKPVLTDLQSRGLIALDDGSSQRSQLARVARETGTPWAVSGRTIDANPSQQAIDENLASLENLALTTGSVVATGYAYPMTLERIALWAETLEEKGIVLAPLSAHILNPK